ncbi:ribosomal protein S18-alanine N-acetyltransferase [Panacagrimonas sp.]|uniref:ribosomal protein S18-alanine N-acetyltransferase n=1 Tax=Panacagrimonas sp. TaxID=2480088 RepID=UPI003B51FA84
MSALPQIPWRLSPLHESHLPQVMELEHRAYPFPWTEGIFRDCIKAGYAGWVVGDRSAVMRGYAVMSMAVGEAHILNLAVDPMIRRQGLGRFLLAHLIQIARAAHSTIMLLEVRRSNKAAIRLYQAAGFRHIGTRRGYYPGHEQREDAYVLALDLE